MPNEQTWSPESYQRSANFVAEHGVGVVDWLDPKPGERILDLGCGDGVLTENIRGRGAEIIGVDASREMVEAAQARGLDARVIDGHALPFEAEFDAVFSNAALHWMTRPNSVIAGVRKSLKPRGRFVGEFGGFGNVAAIRAAMLAIGRHHGIDPTLADPWFFPDEKSYARRLSAGGFLVERMTLFPRPTPLPETGIRGWLKVFRQPFFEAFGGPAEQESALDLVVNALQPLRAPDGRWMADYVRLRFVARRV